MPNLVMLALSQLAVFFLILSDSPSQALYQPEVYMLVLASSLTGASGYIINDYYDIKIDWINKPERVVISRFIDRRYALILHFSLNFIALVLSAFLGWSVLLSILFTEMVLWWYSNHLKRTAFWGNFLVAFLSAYSLLLPALMWNQFPPSVLFFAGFAFLISLIRELVKDVEDMDGDIKYGCSTLAIRWGMSGIKKSAYLLLILLAMGMIVFSWYFFNQILLYYCILVIFPLFVLLAYKTYKARNTSDFGQLSLICKLIMLAGMTSMIWG
jgi:4-hydroxybenzoate polyprenyltransferase